MLIGHVYDATGVYTRVDFKAKALRAYGEPSMIEKAQEIIQEEVKRLEGIEITRVVDWPGGVGYFIREGFARLKETVGEGRVCLDLTSRPAKITVRGDEETKYDLDRLIDESKALSAAGIHGSDLADKEAVCPICTENVPSGEHLGCGHTYCAGCLKHLLASAVDTKTFPLACLGNDGSCASPFPIPFLRRFIPLQALNELEEAAFIAYMESHGQELQYCRTRDCKQIYRRQSTAVKIQCSACMTEICAACDAEAHEGLACNIAAQDAEHDEAVAKTGCKKCPGCSTWIEKSSGRNQMHCGYCVLLDMQSSIRPEYYVMGREHGSIYGDTLPDDIGLAQPADFIAEQPKAFR